MCMEDVQIGRATQTFRTKNTLSAASSKILSNNPQRFTVHFTPPSSGIAYIMPGIPAVSGQGYTLAAGDPPLRLLVQHDGQQVTGEWYAISDASAPTLWVFEEWLRPGTGEFPAEYPGGK